MPLDNTTFKTLVTLKFGDERGHQTRAATALGMRQSNFSRYYRGLEIPSTKHIDNLEAMPDYEAPVREFVYHKDKQAWVAQMILDSVTLSRAKTVAQDISGVSLDMNAVNTSKFFTYLINKEYDKYLARQKIKSAKTKHNEDPLG